MPVAAPRFVGDTKACFGDFITKHPQLSVIQLVAEFCDKADTPTVQKWQLGAHWPVGHRLLHLRCFLSLAGYEVTEMQRLEGNVKQLAMIVGLQLERVTPEAVAEKLGYDSVKKVDGLWRITLKGGGFQPPVREQIDKLCRIYGKEAETKASEWRGRIAQVTGGELTVSPPPPVTQENLIPIVAAAFGRTVATAIALGNALLKANEEQAAREATSGGMTMNELVDIFRRLSAQQE
jgi:hypothetical protein